MTVNIISDVHATQSASGEVVYALQAASSLEDLGSMAEQLQAACKAGYESQAGWESYAFWRRSIGRFRSFELLLDALGKAASSARSGFSVFSHEEAAELAAALDAASSGASRMAAKQAASRMAAKRAASRMAATQTARSKAQYAALSSIPDIVDSFIPDFMKLAMAFKPECLEPADLLLVAGDLGTMDSYDAVLEDLQLKTAGKFKRVLAVPGNHDCWKMLPSTAAKDLHGSWVKVEEVLGDVAVLGCTLWTPVSKEASLAVQMAMNDYRWMPGCKSPACTTALFQEQSAWLKSAVAEHAAAGRKLVVMTHHCPSAGDLVPERFRTARCKAVNESYVVSDGSLDSFPGREKIALWACGHTHTCYDGLVGGVRVVRNPIGYGSLYGFWQPENMSRTWYSKVVEV